MLFLLLFFIIVVVISIIIVIIIIIIGNLDLYSSDFDGIGVGGCRQFSKAPRTWTSVPFIALFTARVKRRDMDAGG